MRPWALAACFVLAQSCAAALVVLVYSFVSLVSDMNLYISAMFWLFLCTSKVSNPSHDAMFRKTESLPDQVWGNINAPRAVTMSAIIYCLRCLVGHDIPLNQGCLNPVKVVIPPGSLLDPSEDAAVVGKYFFDLFFSSSYFALPTAS